MITKCTDLILARRKFSEFADADLNDPSLTIVGFQNFDGELENVQINLKEMLDWYFNMDTIERPVFNTLTGDGSCMLQGDPNCVRTFRHCDPEQPNATILCFDYSLTGDFIQANGVASELWEKDDTKARLHITFENMPVGKKLTLFLKNVPTDTDAYVVLHSVGPDEKVRLYGDTPCPWCHGDVAYEVKLTGDKVMLQFVQTTDLTDDNLVKATRFLTSPYNHQ